MGETDDAEALKAARKAYEAIDSFWDDEAMADACRAYAASLRAQKVSAQPESGRKTVEGAVEAMENAAFGKVPKGTYLAHMRVALDALSAYVGTTAAHIVSLPMILARLDHEAEGHATMNVAAADLRSQQDALRAQLREAREAFRGMASKLSADDPDDARVSVTAGFIREMLDRLAAHDQGALPDE